MSTLSSATSLISPMRKSWPTTFPFSRHSPSNSTQTQFTFSIMRYEDIVSHATPAPIFTYFTRGVYVFFVKKQDGLIESTVSLELLVTTNIARLKHPVGKISGYTSDRKCYLGSLGQRLWQCLKHRIVLSYSHASIYPCYYIVSPQGPVLSMTLNCSHTTPRQQSCPPWVVCFLSSFL